MVTVVVAGEPQAVMVVMVFVFVLVIVECATAVHYTQDPSSSAAWPDGVLVLVLACLARRHRQ